MRSAYPRDFHLLARPDAMRKEQLHKLAERRERTRPNDGKPGREGANLLTFESLT